MAQANATPRSTIKRMVGTTDYIYIDVGELLYAGETVSGTPTLELGNDAITIVTGTLSVLSGKTIKVQITHVSVGMTRLDISFATTIPDVTKNTYIMLQTYRAPSDGTTVVTPTQATQFDSRLDALEAGIFNVLDYGVIGNGIVNDTTAFNLAYNAAIAENGIVFVPPNKTIILKPVGATPALYMDTGFHLKGSGRTSVIKVIDDAGDYAALFRQRNLSVDVDNVTIEDIFFDLNPSGNTTCDIRAGVTNQSQVTLYFTRGHNILIQNCWFDPCCGVNTISINGGHVALNDVVKDCWFRFVAGRTLDPTGEYDNSAVYIDSHSHTATGNRFDAEYAERARGCIESHSGSSVIDNNHSRGFETLCNIVSQSDTPTTETNSITVSNNTAVEALHGIMLWSITGKVLKNVTVSGNTIYVNNADRARTNYHGIGLARGTGIEGAFENINIIGNTIQCQKENRAGTGEGDSGGLMFYGYGPFKGFHVSNNIVNSSPIHGMRVQTTGATGFFDETEHVQNCDFSNNLFIDCGNNNLAGARISVFVAGSFERVTMHDNNILDSGAVTAYGQYGLSTALVGGSSLHWYDNYVDGRLFFSPAANSTIGVETPISFTLPNGVTTVTPSPGSNTLHEYIIDDSSSNFTVTQSLGVNAQRMTFRIKNTSSGAGVTISWHSTWHMQAWVNPASGYNKTIEFMKTASTAWYEVYRSGDIPN